MVFAGDCVMDVGLGTTDWNLKPCVLSRRSCSFSSAPSPVAMTFIEFYLFLQSDIHIFSHIESTSKKIIKTLGYNLMYLSDSCVSSLLLLITDKMTSLKKVSKHLVEIMQSAQL